jgi:hypothetical protein
MGVAVLELLLWADGIGGIAGSRRVDDLLFVVLFFL